MRKFAKIILLFSYLCPMSILLSKNSIALDSHKIDLNDKNLLPNNDSLKNNESVLPNKKTSKKIKKKYRDKAVLSNSQKTLPIFARQQVEQNGSDTAYLPDFDGSGGSGPAMPQDEGIKKNGYYRETRGYRLEPEIDVPAYVRQADKTYPQLGYLSWLNVGLESRTRFEFYDNDYRPWVYNNPFSGMSGYRRQYPESLWLERTRGYIGVKDILDPLRFVLELQDSREFNNIYSLQQNQINKSTIVQGYGELYFKNALGVDGKGQGRPISFRAGRMAFDIGDRRLISRNSFLNTTINFDGFRLKLGEKENDFDIDSFVMRPVRPNQTGFDKPDWQNWIYGSWISIHRWSQFSTIQPYFLGRHQYADLSNQFNTYRYKREIAAPGLRAYGVINGFDYDVNIMKQFGQVGEASLYTPTIASTQRIVRQDATAFAGDFGYTFEEHPWRPRISAVYVYASGNNGPYNTISQSVDTFYPYNQPFSRSRYFNWNNIKDPKVRLVFEPVKNTRIDTAFSSYWLASPSGAWERAGLYAPLGNRGSFLGTEFDFRVQQKISEFLDISFSYDRVWPGSFASSFAPPVAQQWPPVNLPGGYFPGQSSSSNGITSRPSDFFYLEATANAFGDGKPIAEIPGSGLFLASHEPEVNSQYNWTDVYVGLNAGGAWSSPTMTVQDGAFSGSTTSFQSQAIANSTLNIFPTTYTNKLKGFIGGFQTGIDWQIGKRIVIGAKTDLEAVSGNTNSTGSLINSYSNNNLFTTYGQHSSTLNYIGTIRPTLGYLFTSDVKIYGTSGLAYGGVVASNSYTSIINTSPLSPKFFGPQFIGSLVGWSAGGGIEWRFLPEWSLNGEYVYYDLGHVNVSSLYSSIPWTPYNVATNYSNGFGNISAMQAHFNGSLVHAGVNRHFDIGEIETLGSKLFKGLLSKN
jgi:opacity protein-like surface antigen